MKPPIETIRISRQGREQLTKIRRQTGIENWNVLCRWSFCASMREQTPPPPVTQKLDGGVEMTWKVFAGDQSEIFAALTLIRTRKDGFPLSSEGVANCLRAHLHRGLAYLASGKDTKSLSDLVKRWLDFGKEV
jgi:DNA sulfur modification protein DndE